MYRVIIRNGKVYPVDEYPPPEVWAQIQRIVYEGTNEPGGAPARKYEGIYDVGVGASGGLQMRRRGLSSASPLTEEAWNLYAPRIRGLTDEDRSFPPPVTPTEDVVAPKYTRSTIGHAQLPDFMLRESTLADQQGKVPAPTITPTSDITVQYPAAGETVADNLPYYSEYLRWKEGKGTPNLRDYRSWMNWKHPGGSTAITGGTRKATPTLSYMKDYFSPESRTPQVTFPRPPTTGSTIASTTVQTPTARTPYVNRYNWRKVGSYW